MKKMKKPISLFLTFILCFSQFSAICFAKEGIALTDSVLEKIIAPYNTFLEKGVWELLEYREDNDESITYTMKMDNGEIANVRQVLTNDVTVLEVTEGDTTNVLEMYSNNRAVLDGKEISVKTVVETNEVQPRKIFDWRESGPYFGTPGIYTKKLTTSDHNVLLEQAIADIAVSVLIAYIGIYVPGFAAFMEICSAPADMMTVVKSTLALYNPETYQIYLRDARYEPDTLYIQAGSGYLKWTQAFYYDKNFSKLGRELCQWGRTAQ